MAGKLALYSWALYDFANTIFSAVVLTFYFPLYLTAVTQRNLNLGVTTSTAMILAGLVVPWLGALSDRTGKTKAYLILTTLSCVVFTVSLSFLRSVPLLMGVFLLSCFFYHASLVFYCALLPVVAEPDAQGRASGLGTAWGYLGVLFVMPIAFFVDYFFARRFVFLVAGILFLAFSIPLILWVPERKVTAPVKPTVELFIREWIKVFKTLRSLGKNRTLLFFFLGNFFVMEAMNTVIFWLVVYLSRVFNPPQIYLVATFLGLNLTAFLFGFLAGRLTDRWGSQKVMEGAAGTLFVTVLVLALTRNFWVFAALGLTGGAFSLAAVWTAARKRVVELSPAGEIGEYFGLYNLTTKISVASSLVFSLLADRFGFQAALLSQAVPAALGLYFLWRSSKGWPYSPGPAEK